MKLRDYFFYSEGIYTFTVKKEDAEPGKKGKAPYNVVRTERITTSCSYSHKTTIKEWKKALAELQRQLRVYTSLTKEQIREFK